MSRLDTKGIELNIIGIKFSLFDNWSVATFFKIISMKSCETVRIRCMSNQADILNLSSMSRKSRLDSEGIESNIICIKFSFFNTMWSRAVVQF